MRNRRILALCAAVALPLAGCGSTSSTSSPTPSATGSASSTSSASPTGGSAPAGQCPPAEGAAKRTTSFTAAPPMCIDAAKTYTATMTTDAGPLTIELDAKKAPKTVNNFVFLARNGFYDGLTFHRVIKGFMAQGGDPKGTGEGGPGYEFADELPQPNSYKVGSIAMANAGPNTNGSQFFIVTGPHGEGLKPNYSLFGRVTGGLDALTKIEADGTEGEGTPAKVHTITKVTVSEK